MLNLRIKLLAFFKLHFFKVAQTKLYSTTKENPFRPVTLQHQTLHKPPTPAFLPHQTDLCSSKEWPPTHLSFNGAC